MLRITFLLTFLSVAPLYSFPEMVRHGYPNCISCHVSPNGGGLLTQYGRGLSREVLSTWGSESEVSFLYGKITPPEWLNLGGDFRAVQTYMNSPALEQAKLIFMQADIAAAASYKKFQLVASLGRQEPSTSNLSGGTIISRQHYLNFRPTDELSFRAGKFQSAFGINTAEHIISIKRGLQWDEGSETYNVEAAWLSQDTDLFVTAILGRPDASNLNLESGLAVRASVSLAEKHKVGASYYYGSGPRGNRHVLGPYAILGFSPRFFVLGELDFQKNTLSSGISRWGLVSYLKVDYEFLQGLHGYLTGEILKADLSAPNTTTETYGLGVQFFPRPHLEANAMFLKQRMPSVSDGFSDFLWLLLHFYL